MGKEDASLREPRERELAESVLAHMDVAVFAVDARGQVDFVNAAAAEAAARTPRELRGRPFASLVDVEHRHRIQRALSSARAGHPVRSVECAIGYNGSARWVELDVSPGPAPGGGCLVVAHDVGSRRAVRTALATQHEDLQETLASLLDSIPVGILIADHRGRPRLVNRVARELLGIHALTPVHAWRQKGFLRRPDGRPSRDDDLPFESTMDDGRAHRDIELRIVTPGGEIVPVLLNTDAVRDRDGRVVEICCTFTNISERRHIERQLQHAQKMEAVGTLAGGIAHDFNNILCAINGYSELALRQINGDDRLQRLIDEIKQAGGRAAKLTRQLLSFSRDETLAPQVIDLNEAVAGMRTMLGRLIGETVTMQTELAGFLEPIHADPGQVEQVLLNLVINASDAMPSGGRLEVRTDCVETNASHPVCNASLPPGRYSVLSVTDSGCGMDEDVLAHAFEPFYTTKPRGKGTGLGLSTVYGIVKQNGGYIDVRSAPNLGTTFQVFWPCVDAEPTTHAAPQPREARSHGGETVLLVEDEDMVRSLIREILEAARYHVLEASNGREALDLCSTCDERIDLLITDVVMPELNGSELASRLRTIRPEVRVLFVSGYTDDALAQYGIVNGEQSFLPKPFDTVTLTRRVRELLDHDGAPDTGPTLDARL